MHTAPSTNTTATPSAAQQPPVRVSLLLPSASIVSGDRVNATLVIENDSGAPVVSNSCLQSGESVLGQIGLLSYPPSPTSPTTMAPNGTTTSVLPTHGGPCMGPTHVLARVGTTRVPFVLEASSGLCQLAPATQLQVPACWPGGTALRPGTYYLGYDWYGELPTPTIAVPVVAAPRTASP